MAGVSKFLLMERTTVYLGLNIMIFIDMIWSPTCGKKQTNFTRCLLLELLCVGECLDCMKLIFYCFSFIYFIC